MPALVPTLALRSFDALALTLLDKAPFHLRDHAQDSKNHVAHLTPRADVRIENGDRSTALLAFVDQV